MKKTMKKLTFSALMATAALGLPACGKEAVNLYGPDLPESDSAFHADSNINDDVYGPPVIDDMDEEDGDGYDLPNSAGAWTSGITPTPSFPPSENVADPMYGPAPAKG